MADRIIVFSKRPGRVSMDFNVEFENDDTEMPPLQRRDDPAFRRYFNLIRKELGINA